MLLITIFITLKSRIFAQPQHVQVFGKLQSYLILSNNNLNLNWLRIVRTADKYWTRASIKPNFDLDPKIINASTNSS